jgi:hypothetical protein
MLTPNSSPSKSRLNPDEPKLQSLASSYQKRPPRKFELKLSFVRYWCRCLQQRLTRDITAQPVMVDVRWYLHAGLPVMRRCSFWGARLPLVWRYGTKFLLPCLSNQKAIWGLNKTSFTLVLASCEDEASFALVVATCKRACAWYRFTAGHGNTPYACKEYYHKRLPSDIARSSARSGALTILRCGPPLFGDVVLNFYHCDGQNKKCPPTFNRSIDGG